jgi:hypothetical protein
MSKKRKAPVLRSQEFDAGGPGSVLSDFETLLDFIGPDGVRAAGKYHFLPIERLDELDAKMTNPLRPGLERPQQRSFPHIDGLYLLLRATGLGVPQGMGKKTGMLVLDQVMLEQWRALNATERYFNLLEAWLRRGRSEMLGEGVSWMSTMVAAFRELWQRVAIYRGADKRFSRDALYGRVSYCCLALAELFGLLDVPRGGTAGEGNWQILDVRPTEFGEAVVETIFDKPLDLLIPRARQEDEPEFGAWQAWFQERNNLTLPEPEQREGVFIFKAKLGSVWRRIAVPAECELDALAWAIIRGFKFDGDHLYDFRFSGRDGSQVRVVCPYIEDAEAWTDEYSIGHLPLAEGQSMEFEYDYGASWRFDVKLEKVAPPDARMKKPRVLESHGTPPKEYDGW